MKMKRRILLALLGILVGWGGAGIAHADVTFQVTDNPGSWFDCSNDTSTTTSILGCVPSAFAGNGKSLAIIKRGESITFQSGNGNANTVHTVVSLIYPTPAKTTLPNGFTMMPFDTDVDVGTSSDPIKPNELGLHVFFCDIHPYMFATVIVVKEDTIADALTNGLDLGKTLDLPRVAPAGFPNGVLGLPTASDLALRLVHTFFIITNPDNWQNFPLKDNLWSPSYPPVQVVAYDVNGNPVRATSSSPTLAGVTDLNLLMHAYFGEPKTLTAYAPPSHPGVGQVWLDTQFEMMTNDKTKPGTATAVNAGSWKVERKVGLPRHGTHHGNGMNNPHNMWTDKDQRVIYQTEWFDHYLAVFDRQTGAFVNRIETGLAPAHVMTRTNNDQVHVSQNGGNNVRELDSLTNGNGFLKDISVGNRTAEDIANGDPDAHTHPHAHWMSADGHMMVTPNADTENSSLFDFRSGTFKQAKAGNFPIATGMMPDSSKYYVANFLDSTISVFTIDKTHGTPAPIPSATINLLGDSAHGIKTYDPIHILVPGNSPVGALPIQLPVSPDGKYVVVANTLAANILVIRTSDDQLVKTLTCDAGCHGAQWGAKQGGGYYAYVSSKFSNRMLVVDPGNDGTDAAIVGSVLLTTANASSHFHTDGTVDKYPGMGGQGVLPIPLVYNGWVQNLPEEWKEKLTKAQKHPFPGHDDHK